MDFRPITVRVARTIGNCIDIQTELIIESLPV
jgi:hypothetical protein